MGLGLPAPTPAPPTNTEAASTPTNTEAASTPKQGKVSPADKAAPSAPKATAILKDVKDKAASAFEATYTIHSATQLSSDIDQFGQSQGTSSGASAPAVHSQLKAEWKEQTITRAGGARVRSIQLKTLDMTTLIGGQVVSVPPAARPDPEDADLSYG